MFKITMILITSLSSPALAAFHYKDKVRVSNKDSFFYGSVGRVMAKSSLDCRDRPMLFVELDDGANDKFCEYELELIKK